MCRVCAGFPANSVLTLRMRRGSSVSTGGRFGFAAHRAAEFVGGRPTAIFQTFPPSGRGSFVRAPSGRFIGTAFGGGDCRVPPRGGLRFSAHRAAQFVGGRPTASSFLACPRKEPKKGTRGLGGLPGHRCAPRLRRAPQSGDAHSKRATGATCPFGTNGVPIRAVASRPLWIPRRESPCDPALRAGTLSGAACGRQE